MKSPIVKFLTASIAVAWFAGVAGGQEQTQVVLVSKASDDTSKTVAVAQPPKTEASMYPKIVLSHYRPVDMRGLNVFEPPKEDLVPWTGFKLDFGAAFTQQFQGLDHSNTASPKMVTPSAGGTPVDANKLVSIGHGFNNAVANLYLNAQLAKGIRVAMTSYLSSRHHNETWVKDGYLLIDESPFGYKPLEKIMQYVTVRAGHFELNYGDAHFRRTDNGNALFNPLVGNYLMDAFTTEIGAEVYARTKGFMVMGAVTGGEVRGQITRPSDRAPSFIGKAGFDRQISKDLRVRLTGSMYQTDKSVNNTLYSGDRAGSRYYDVLENTSSTETAQAWSGAIQPGFRSAVRAMVLNPFVKYRGLELFGNIEQAKGKAANETAYRKWNQNVGEVVYRFLPNDRAYVAARYNTARGALTGITNKVSVDRTQLGGGLFITPTIMLKGEYVNQKYNDFPATDIRNGGKFKGYLFEGTVAF